MEEAREERRDLASEKTESSRSPALDLGREVERKKQEKETRLSRHRTLPAASLSPISVQYRKMPPGLPSILLGLLGSNILLLLRLC